MYYLYKICLELNGRTNDLWLCKFNGLTASPGDTRFMQVVVLRRFQLNCCMIKLVIFLDCGGACFCSTSRVVCSRPDKVLRTDLSASWHLSEFPQEIQPYSGAIYSLFKLSLVPTEIRLRDRNCISQCRYWNPHEICVPSDFLFSHCHVNTVPWPMERSPSIWLYIHAPHVKDCRGGSLVITLPYCNWIETTCWLVFKSRTSRIGEILGEVLRSPRPFAQ